MITYDCSNSLGHSASNSLVHLRYHGVICVETCDRATALAALMVKRKQQQTTLTAGELLCENYHLV